MNSRGDSSNHTSNNSKGDAMNVMHASEPWTATANNRQVHDSRGMQVVYVASARGDKEAAACICRIVACVNACKGISSTALDGGVIADVLTALQAVASEARKSERTDILEIIRPVLAKLDR